jgi:hypothetical protein
MSARTPRSSRPPAAPLFGKSRNALNASSLDTTDTLPLRVVGLVESPTNASGDAFTDVLVVFNNTQQILTKLGV